MQHVAAVIVALKIVRKHYVTRIDFLHNIVALKMARLTSPLRQLGNLERISRVPTSRLIAAGRSLSSFLSSFPLKLFDQDEVFPAEGFGMYFHHMIQSDARSLSLISTSLDAESDCPLIWGDAVERVGGPVKKSLTYC